MDPHFNLRSPYVFFNHPLFVCKFHAPLELQSLNPKPQTQSLNPETTKKTFRAKSTTRKPWNLFPKTLWSANVADVDVPLLSQAQTSNMEPKAFEKNPRVTLGLCWGYIGVIVVICE